MIKSRVMLSRRSLIGLAAAPLWFPMPAAAAANNLIYAEGRLMWPGGEARAACGKGGVKADKREGDGASPLGTFKLLYGFFRPDRVKWPQTALPMTPLRPDFAWVDDPEDRNYNRLVYLPYKAHHEKMWRDDPLYDIVVVVDYNIEPVKPGAGSAIFLHVARPNYTPTEGCIAVAYDDLVTVLGLIDPGSSITIRL